ncbi:MAG: hypothetical protein LBP78_01360, partial [Acidaminococcales bacterium]|nr:hypothetical protein [Acidaminococcales bacterium]
MRKLAKLPRKMKTIALGVGAASLLLGGAPARAAAAEKPEYTYDGYTISGDYDAPTANGSVATPENPGKYMNWAETGGEWFAPFVGGDNVYGLWRYDLYGGAATHDNRVIVSYGDSTFVPAFVFGGVAEALSNETVAGNEVHYSGGGVSAGVLIGGVSYYGSASGNKVFYYGGGLDGLTYSGVKYAIIGGAAQGGSAHAAKAGQNEVRITGSGDIEGGVAGGLIISNSSAGEAFENSVVITGYSGYIGGSVIGASAQGASATGNTVSIDGAGQTLSIGGDVIGNRSAKGSAIGQGGGSAPDVYLTGGEFNGYVIGGLVEDGTSLANAASDHLVVIDGATLIGGPDGSNIYGGLINGTGTARGNKITIIAGAGYAGYVYGGYVNNGDVIGNEVTIIGAAMPSAVIGGEVGFDGTGAARRNIVTIAGGSVDDNVIGGVVYEDGEAIGNEVWINDGTVFANIYGGHASGSGAASGNEVWINDGTVSYNIYGGYASGSGAASGNHVTLQGSSQVGGYIYGGYASGSGAASGNEIRIEGGTVSDPILGGMAPSGNALGNRIWIKDAAVSNVVGGAAIINEASGNQITIEGGAVSGQVVGGYVVNNDSNGTANNNIITFSGGITFSGASLCGYFYNSGNVAHEGNTLNVYNLEQTGSLNTVSNFDQYDFKIDRKYANGYAFALTADAVAMAGATVKGIEITGGGSKLSDGDTVGLIAATSLASTEYNDTDEKIVDGLQGVSTLYKFDVRLN